MIIPLKHTGTELIEAEKQKFRSQGFRIVRVISEQKERYTVAVDENELNAEVTGHLMYTGQSRKDFPAVGDWVAVQLFDENSPAIIHGILPRTTTLIRKAVGKAFEEQIIAANVDLVFIVQSLDQDFNLRRLERSLVVVNESGALPAILLSKSDLMPEDEYEQKVKEARNSAPDIRVIPYSAKTLSHIEEIRALIAPSTTVCFVGSSGVGKSTLINKLIGQDILLTQKVRESDSKGRHSTTHRQLLALQNGGFVIDTPGMRELGLWTVGEDSILDAFPEIVELSSNCRFNDCTHIHEPDCAILEAVENGSLDRDRYHSYLKLRKEAEFIESKTSVLKQQERKAKEKRMGKLIKEVLKRDKRK